MQELLFGTWGSPIVSFGRQIVAYGVQHPWRVFAAILIVALLTDMMFRNGPAGDGIDGFDFGGDGGDGD
ncbi:hypothetical protein JQ597_16910 [Bradyrhizobium sp. AUGA SZCCT0177]|uniref:hypothetical protein n=1 Tax=Bradyrhizobium sp. AUGA SZCCT0177 TaxID=2807665 RepID=UPI001BA7DF08|nr:hypothetical protein [Bradyrhizobium sp. AUGA SZCCT0177]MBR1283728.1 hypothetical protein [Bradyrhizobium sp. AUGA SZCCT0177]